MEDTRALVEKLDKKVGQMSRDFTLLRDNVQTILDILRHGVPVASKSRIPESAHSSLPDSASTSMAGESTEDLFHLDSSVEQVGCQALQEEPDPLSGSPRREWQSRLNTRRASGPLSGGILKSQLGDSRLIGGHRRVDFMDTPSSAPATANSVLGRDSGSDDVTPSFMYTDLHLQGSGCKEHKQPRFESRTPWSEGHSCGSHALQHLDTNKVSDPNSERLPNNLRLSDTDPSDEAAGKLGPTAGLSSAGGDRDASGYDGCSGTTGCHPADTEQSQDSLLWPRDKGDYSDTWEPPRNVAGANNIYTHGLDRLNDYTDKPSTGNCSLKGDSGIDIGRDTDLSQPHHLPYMTTDL